MRPPADNGDNWYNRMRSGTGEKDRLSDSAINWMLVLSVVLILVMYALLGDVGRDWYPSQRYN